METELKDIEWLESFIKRLAWKDVEYEDIRGPIKELSIYRDGNGVLVTLILQWWAVYKNMKWATPGEEKIIQFLNPKIELLDEKMVRISIEPSFDYCIIFFGYENIVPQKDPG